MDTSSMDTSSTTEQAAVDPDVAVAFDVLAQATRALLRENGGVPPTASEVHLRMRSITYGGFKAKTLGFARFRDFLAAAERESIVRVDSTRVGDVGVAPFETNEFPESPNRKLSIRGDLWRAVVDWTPGQTRLIERAIGKVHVIPTTPAPLEPEKIATVRKRFQDSPEEFVVITPITMKEQVQWMRDFSDSLQHDPRRELLLSALEGDKPAKYYTALLRDAPDLNEAWHRRLRDMVEEHLLRWRRDAGAEDIDIYPRLPTESPTRAPASRAGASTDSIAAIARIVGTPSIANRAADGSESMREALHRAIDRMPMEQLRRIEIPVGYLFED